MEPVESFNDEVMYFFRVELKKYRFDKTIHKAKIGTISGNTKLNEWF